MESFYGEADGVFTSTSAPRGESRAWSVENWGESISGRSESRCTACRELSGEIEAAEQFPYAETAFCESGEISPEQWSGADTANNFAESGAQSFSNEDAEAAFWTEQGLEYPEASYAGEVYEIGEHERFDSEFIEPSRFSADETSLEWTQYAEPERETPADCFKSRGDEPKFKVYPGATAEGMAEPYKTADPKIYGVTLLDYKVNDHSLRPAHEQALQALIAKIAADERAGLFSQSGGWQIDINGFASKTGNIDHNKTLSYWRANVAARALECLAAQAGLPPRRVSIKDVVGHGFEDDAIQNLEDPRRRRIQLSVHPPVVNKPEKPRTSNKFRICIEKLDPEVHFLPLPKFVPPQIRAVTEIMGYAKVTARYRIYDRELNSAQTYLYVGKGVVIQVPLDRVIPKKVKDKIPKSLWNLLGKVLGSIVPGGKDHGRGCTNFDVNVHRTADPIRNPPPVVEVRSFGGATDLAIPAPGLGGVQIGFKNSIFRYNGKATYSPNPLEIDWPRNLATRLVILTEGSATQVAATSREAGAEESSAGWLESNELMPAVAPYV